MAEYLTRKHQEPTIPFTCGGVVTRNNRKEGPDRSQELAAFSEVKTKVGSRSRPCQVVMFRY